jgi:hypothetical protein
VNHFDFGSATPPGIPPSRAARATLAFVHAVTTSPASKPSVHPRRALTSWGPLSALTIGKVGSSLNYFKSLRLKLPRSWGAMIARGQ